MLGKSDVYQAIKAVDISAAVASLDKMQFVFVNQTTTDPCKPKCDVVLQDKFTPEIKALIESLGIGGQIIRCLLRKLRVGQDIAPYVASWIESDNWRRFDLPLVTDPSVEMFWPEDGVSIHLEAGKLYEVRFDRPNGVRQGSKAARIHLQIDVIDATIAPDVAAPVVQPAPAPVFKSPSRGLPPIPKARK